MPEQSGNGSITTNAPICGTWRLESVTIQTNADALHPMGDNPIGTLIYTNEGRYSVQLFPEGRTPCAADDLMGSTPEEIVANAGRVVSYFGHYTFHPKVGYVIHNIEGSLFPNWEGQAHKRYFTIEDNRLTLKSEPMSLGGESAVAVIVWEKLV